MRVVVFGLFSLSIFIAWFIGIRINYSKNLTPSQIMIEVQEYLDKLTRLDNKTKQMLTTNPFKDLIEEINPVIDVVNSLVQEIDLYEQILQSDPIPHRREEAELVKFAKSSIFTLERLHGKLFGIETMYRIISAQLNHNISQGIKRELLSLKNGYNFVILGNEEQLDELRIYFTPDPEEERKFGRDLKNEEITLNTILEIIIKLGILFHELETQIPKVQIIDLLRGAVRARPQHYKLMLEIHDLTAKHGDDTLTYTSSLVNKITQNISERMDQILAHHHQCKLKYEELVFEIGNTIGRAKVRLKPLANQL